MNRALIVILGAVLLDAVGIGLVFPILPALLREVTGSGEISTLYGVMLAVYALMQFLFAPVLGALSDKYGRRPVLLISLAGVAVDYVIMAMTPHLWVLFVGRVIAGVSSANLAVATAYIADISASTDRARRFGLIHAAFGIGFIIGPLLGGLLGEYWTRAPFLAAAVLNGLNFALALFVLPESREGEGGRLSREVFNPFLPLKAILAFRPLLPLLVIYFAIHFVGQTYDTIWVLYGEDRFAWSSAMVGLSLAAYGLFHAGTQAALVAPAIKRLGEHRTLLLGLSLEAVSAIILAFAAKGWMVFALLPLFGLAGLGFPALQAMITNQVDEDRQGRLQGVLSSLVSLSAVFGPLVFSSIYFLSRDSFNGLVWIVSALIYVPVVALLAAAGRTQTDD